VRALLDTCVLADLRRPGGHPAPKAAVALLSDDDLYVSALTLGEVARAISLLPDGRKKRNLRAWLTGLHNSFGDRILMVDQETAELWGEIVARAHQAGYVLDVVESLLAATALRHGLHVMTRNTPAFVATGALIIDPYPAGFDASESP
jgi:toxin FitB